MNTRALLLASVAVLAPACVKIHDFNGDGGTGSGDGGDGDGGASDLCRTGENACLYEAGGKLHAEVYGRYNLTFSDEGFGFPSSLSTAGALELLGAPPDLCSAEKGVGVAYSPATVISSVASGLTGSSVASVTTTKMIPGPGVAKVAIEWQANLARCSSSPRGRSSFTFFPDGRITRMDIVHTGPDAIDASSCSCPMQSGSSWELSTYWAFALSAFDENSVQGFKGAIPATNGDNKAVDQVVCMPGANHTLGLATPLTVNRARRLGDDVSVFADMLSPSSMLPVDMMYEASTSMYITTSAAENCTTVLGYLAPFSQDLQIYVEDSGGGYSRGLADDGIYGGEFGGMEGMGGISFAGPTLTIQPYNGVRLPAFALWLNRPSITSVTDADASAPAPRYTDQLLPSGVQHILWFPDGLAPGQTLIIEAGT